MDPLRCVVGGLLLATAQLSVAVQPAGPVPPMHRSPAAGEVVERGGTVDAVDATRLAIVVDGVAYAIPRGSVRIHLAPNRVSGVLSDLKPGMQIRFTSLTDDRSKQTHVREIWVTGVRARSRP